MTFFWEGGGVGGGGGGGRGGFDNHSASVHLKGKARNL